MKNIAILAASAALVLTACAPKEEAPADTKGTASTTSAPAVTVAYEIGSKKKGDMGVCVMCNAKEGTTAEEEVKDMIDYEGKTYLFCNESEKAEFISDPKKYAKK